MEKIRKANIKDTCRIAEIEIFNYRLNFYSIFKEDRFYFDVLQVINKMNKYDIDHIYVYDDGVVKGFIQVKEKEIEKLFVEPILQNQKIGSKLLEYAVNLLNVNHLWALEKNKKAISFYQKHGFQLTNEKKFEEDTTEYLVHLIRKT